VVSHRINAVPGVFLQTKANEMLQPFDLFDIKQSSSPVYGQEMISIAGVLRLNLSKRLLLNLSRGANRSDCDKQTNGLQVSR
jgi:hypothetical protein